MNPDAYLSALALRSGKLFADLPYNIDDAAADEDTLQQRFDCGGGSDDDDDETSVAVVGRRSLLHLPREHYGYRASVLRYRPLAYRSRYDARATVSLAAFDREAPVVIDYANKLPIICLNVRRFAYTVEAFRFKRYRCVSGSAALSDPQIASGWRDSTWSSPLSWQTPSSLSTATTMNGKVAVGSGTDETTTTNEIARDALQFMVSTDITRVAAWCEETYANTGQRPGANERFSELLHLTRSTGYEEYLFALARLLGTHVDLIKCRGQPADPIDGKPLLRRSATGVVTSAACQGYDPTFDEAEAGGADDVARDHNDDGDAYENEVLLFDSSASGCRSRQRTAGVWCTAKRTRLERPVDADTMARATLGLPPQPPSSPLPQSLARTGTTTTTTPGLTGYADVNGNGNTDDRVTSAIAAFNETVEQRSLSRQRPRFFVRYVRARTSPSNDTLNDGERRLGRLPRSFALTDPSNGDGVLTAIVDGDQWHVRATRTPIVRLAS